MASFSIALARQLWIEAWQEVIELIDKFSQICAFLKPGTFPFLHYREGNRKIPQQ